MQQIKISKPLFLTLHHRIKKSHRQLLSRMRVWREYKLGIYNIHSVMKLIISNNYLLIPCHWMQTICLGTVRRTTAISILLGEIQWIFLNCIPLRSGWSFQSTLWDLMLIAYHSGMLHNKWHIVTLLKWIKHKITLELAETALQLSKLLLRDPFSSRSFPNCSYKNIHNTSKKDCKTAT